MILFLVITFFVYFPFIILLTIRRGKFSIFGFRIENDIYNHITESEKVLYEYKGGMSYLCISLIYSLFFIILMFLVIDGRFNFATNAVLSTACIILFSIMFIYRYRECLDIMFGIFAVTSDCVYVSRLHNLFEIKRYNKKAITEVCRRAIWLGSFIEIKFDDKSIVRLHGANDIAESSFYLRG